MNLYSGVEMTYDEYDRYEDFLDANENEYFNCLKSLDMIIPHNELINYQFTTDRTLSQQLTKCQISSAQVDQFSLAESKNILVLRAAYSLSTTSLLL